MKIGYSPNELSQMFTAFQRPNIIRNNTIIVTKIAASVTKLGGKREKEARGISLQCTIQAFRLPGAFTRLALEFT